MFIDILKLLETAKCKVMLIINKNAITEYIFKKWIVGEYQRTYALSKKIAKHLICINY